MASAPSSVAASSARLPSAIGRFRPTRVLGRGGQGVVYLADDPDLGREVAIKCLSHRTRDPEKLVNEARNVARLDHPNIVALFELELAHEPPYLVYQFASGSSLADYTRTNTPLPVKRIVNIMIAVLDGIHYAHQKGILHRDLTPANILLDDNDHPRILDFGISVALADSTGAATLNGTVNYLAPEVLAENPASPASDLFSLAVVMHELLTGKALFHADNPMAVIYKILNERILPPSSSRQGIDSQLEQLVMKGLEKDPAQRFQSAAAMRDALRDYLAPSESTPAASDTIGDGGAIAFLQRRMARKPDFPAISEHISEINQKSGLRDRSDANELASVILKDYALTTKLLKVVNSAVYGQYGGSISTVSRAVVILGFEQVRAIALGIIIFEHLKNGEQAGLLKDAACSSFLSGMLAKDLCPRERSAAVHGEEAFIAAMFHRLGRHLAIYYFSEEFSEVQALIESKGCDEHTAAREIFGATFFDFGIAIARDWNLPERLLLAMRPQAPGAVKPARTPDARVAQLSGFSNDVAELLGGDPDAVDERLESLVERYKDAVPIEAKRLKVVVGEAVEATRDYAKLINVDLDSTPFLGNVVRAIRPVDEGAPGSGVMPDAGTAEASTAVAGAAATATGAAAIDGAVPAVATMPETESERSARRDVFLTNAISELTTAIIERAPINDMFTMVLEAFYRALGFSHVLFMMRDPKQRAYVTRFGFGGDLEQLKADFVYRIAADDDIFRQAAMRGRNAVIINTGDARYAPQIPAWCSELMQPSSILLFAVVVNKVCLGLIYADTTDSPLSINAQELKLLNTLVKQLTLGINQR
ncbi:MAG: HDOD domain-containing protein [Gammaproteobacteria bacterium]|nr:HDOD domain-containing protein [Gammaproteobacteria bacterium]MCP5201655.1 HDOD domain-containing protein [Gammaproteobacteria bacterium]